MRTARRLTLLLVATLFLLGGTCPPPAPATPTAVTIPMDGFRLEVPPGGLLALFDRTWFFFAGGDTTSFAFNLATAGLVPGSFVEVQDGTGTVLQTITANSPSFTTAVLPGNVGRLRVFVPAALRAPDVQVLSLAATRGGFVAPVSSTMGTTVSAFPLTPGVPVDFGFRDAPPETMYFSIDGLPGGAFDVILVGDARLRIGDTVIHGFPMTDGGAMEVFTPTRPGNGILPGIVLARFPPTGRTTLRFAVTTFDLPRADGIRDRFRARLVVVPAGPEQKLAFPSSEAFKFAAGTPTGMDHDTSPASATGSFIVDMTACVNYDGVSASAVLPVPVIPGSGAPPAAPTVPLAPVCYDEHEGTDWALLPGMMETGADVNAAASGFVVDMADGNADNCFADPTRGFAITCPNPLLPANTVTIRQDDGLIARYFHLRRGSPTRMVVVGDRVVCGQKIAEAASSGNSSGPHLHFELQRWPDSLPSLFVTNVDGNARNFGEPVDPYPDKWRQRVGGVPVAVCQ